MNIANKLTVLRMLLIPVFLYFFMSYEWMPTYAYPIPGPEPVTWLQRYPLGFRYTAIIIFAVAASTDFLDGYLARKLGLVTNFGKFLDPVADKLLVTSALIAMITVLTPIASVPVWVVILIVGRDIMISSFRMIASSENIVIAADMAGKIKTVLQMVMIIYLMLLDTTMTHGRFDDFVWQYGRLAMQIGNVLVWAVAILTVWSAISYLVKNKQVLKLHEM